MEGNENNLENGTVGSELELGSEQGRSNVSESDPLKLIEEATGRKYENLEAAKKGLQETYSYVGKAGQSEKLLSALADKLDLKDAKSVEAFLADKPKAEPAAAPSSDEVKELRFLVEHPELKEHLPVLKKLATAEGSLDAAAQSDVFKTYLGGKEATKASSKSVIESNNRVGMETNDLKPLVDNYGKTGDFSTGQKIVEGMLGLGKK